MSMGAAYIIRAQYHLQNNIVVVNVGQLKPYLEPQMREDSNASWAGADSAVDLV